MKLELGRIQAQNTTSFHEEAIMKWKSISENLLQFSNAIGDFAGRYSEDVLRAFEKFRLLHLKAIRSRVKLYFNYIYVTSASELHPNVKAQGSELECIIRRLFPSKNVVAGVKFVNADALMDRINSILKQGLFCHDQILLVRLMRTRQQYEHFYYLYYLVEF